MSIRQTRIFVPPTLPYNDQNWVETLVGSVINPLFTENHCIIDWFWFSRYFTPKSVDPVDCEIDRIPNEFGINENFQPIGENGLFRSLRFRYSVADQYCDDFETRARELINAQGCFISDFRDYDYIGDLGGDRFTSEDRSNERRLERAKLIEQSLFELCKLFIHCLIGPDENGRYRLEVSDSSENPNHSIFESVHHLFCNITDVPLRVLMGIYTDWNPPNNLIPFGVRF